MDRHDNLALSTAQVITPQHAATREMSDSDRQSLHRLFRDMRRAIGAPPNHCVAALPHP